MSLKDVCDSWMSSSSRQKKSVSTQQECRRHLENHVLAILPPDLPIKDLEWDSGDDEGDQRLPGHHDIHLREKLLPLGLLLVPPARSAKGRAKAVVSSSSEKPSCLLPITPALACEYRAFIAWMTWVFQSLPGETATG